MMLNFTLFRNVVGHVGREAMPETICPTLPDTRIDLSGSLEPLNSNASPDVPDMPDMPDTKNDEFANAPDKASGKTHWKWHLHFVDRNPLTVSCSPEATHDEVMAMYPDAIAAEPVPENAPSEPFDREAWEERAGICEFDGGLTREEAESIAWEEDDRRRCVHCLNLLVSGVCSRASPRGPIVAPRGYRPDPASLQRCPEYRPSPDDPDPRAGRERWPEFRP